MPPLISITVIFHILFTKYRIHTIYNIASCNISHILIHQNVQWMLDLNPCLSSPRYLYTRALIPSCDAPILEGHLFFYSGSHWIRNQILETLREQCLRIVPMNNSSNSAQYSAVSYWTALSRHRTKIPCRDKEFSIMTDFSITLVHACMSCAPMPGRVHAWVSCRDT